MNGWKSFPDLAEIVATEFNVDTSQLTSLENPANTLPLFDLYHSQFSAIGSGVFQPNLMDLDDNGDGSEEIGKESEESDEENEESDEESDEESEESGEEGSNEESEERCSDESQVYDMEQ